MRSRPRFSEAARAAAAAKRKERAGWAARNFAVPSVFVVRARGERHGYSWEIRRFGGVTLACSVGAFDTFAAAREAGSTALSQQLATS